MVLPLPAKLQDPKADCSVLTQVAWSLGKIQDERAIQPLYNLHKKLQAILDPDNADRWADSSPGRNRSSGRSPGQKGSSLAPFCRMEGRDELIVIPVERIEEVLPAAFRSGSPHSDTPSNP